MNSLNKDLEYKEEPRRSLLVAGVKECFKCLGWTQVLHLRQIEVLWAPQMAHFLWSWACPDAISTSLRILVIVSAVIWPSVNKTIACIKPLSWCYLSFPSVQLFINQYPFPLPAPAIVHCGCRWEDEMHPTSTYFIHRPSFVDVPILIVMLHCFEMLRYPPIEEENVNSHQPSSTVFLF